MITYDELVKKHYILQVKRVNPLAAEKPFEPFEGFGIECGQGWFDLLDDLCTKIEIILNKNPKAKKEFHIAQIKEKFGGLRFYTYNVSEEVDKLINNAADKSYNICEICGKSGFNMEIRGWIFAVCKKHAIEYLIKWKKDILDGMSRSERTINILKYKNKLTQEEIQELNESEDWFRIGGERLEEIHKKIKSIS